ncbi:tetratricopeptide repeat protein [Phenylobacterium sp.]|uniref:tetratricopeptide repeat protein n=1 Tax=Phenylobacterium sp. TaxID=1871053 RepID=UPI0025F86D08|nr:tetratricopeptide repeat protein [Phenylobacterium sp.]
MRPAASASLTKAAALERAGDLYGALAAYEAALTTAPDDPEILSPLASLAGRMGLWEVAAQLWAQVSLADPDRLEAVDGQARALRELGRFEPAIGLLREALLAHPQEARLWNSLGVILTQDSQARLALTFLDEAVRLDPTNAAAVYNRAIALFDLDETEAAAEAFAQARSLAGKAADAAMIDFAAATLALARGDLAGGWAAYESRFSPDLPKALSFDVPGGRWALGGGMAGRHMLVVGEQGLGDELMFANVLPDLLAALGPRGRLSLAVEPRLAGLFARSFPEASVGAYVTDHSGQQPRRSVPGLDAVPAVDLWAPMGSLPGAFRLTVAAFPSRPGYLQPDPAAVARWRGWLGSGPPAVGLSWRSGKAAGDRARQYPPAELWAPLLRTPGVRFVNVQYGETAEELAAFRSATGAEILEPPALDLRDDIDGLAALLCALDLTVCVANATGSLAGAVGANVAILGAPAAWPRLGTDALPWYPRAKVLIAPAFGDWVPVMAAAAALVAALAR